MNIENIVQKIWNLCHILRGDGVSYHEYISELTYLLFLKIAEENGTEDLLPKGYRWRDLVGYEGPDLLNFYREMLTYLGGHAESENIRKIYAFPTTVFSHSENLKAVVDGIARLDWHSLSMDGMGDIYEGLLSKNSQDARSGAGQYFTPRALVDSIVKLVQPALGDVVQDPATGSGGFLISADQQLRARVAPDEYDRNPPKYEGVEIEKATFRICLMNAFLHQLDSRLILGDALTSDADLLSPADVILANPPFGAKAGSARKLREDITYGGANKQLAFLQHIYLGLKPGGRAAVVLPDNVLFEEGVGQKIRRELMELCNLHTILRLPSGIFYSPGVKTNVLFFVRGETDSGNTETVWVYDMRHEAPRFGKKRPLTAGDFEPFESAFGSDPSGNAPRVSEGEGGRWRSYDRRAIADRSDNLDLIWLGGSDPAPEELPAEPEEVAAAIIGHLRNALADIQAVADELGDSSGAAQ
ncbi:N-6 DNA methylase [Sphingomonas sp. AP4-R1]|uniref:class I SAM-dependent DNA methyltransferase n=1 Tax=Sphingomonas sp. AP4-R1 TaxID=2735134 RepID=UPI0014937752|nr:N-6 DNA methylase [Sphingomonas sp. AP4-R1]QJU57114.1 N-6 DNA methylase [Sphingomonas sp. AP4-R1]